MLIRNMPIDISYKPLVSITKNAHAQIYIQLFWNWRWDNDKNTTFNYYES